MLGSAGSYLDGGANAPLQKLALPLMELDFIRRDICSLQKHFKEKRDFTLIELKKLGIKVNWSKFTIYFDFILHLVGINDQDIACPIN